MKYQLTVAKIDMKPARSAPDGRGSGAAPTAPAASAGRRAAATDDGDGDDDGESDSSRHRPRPLFLYLDIETIPSADPDLIEKIKAKHSTPSLESLLEAVKPAANLVDERKISADLDKRRRKVEEDYCAACAKSEDAFDAEWRRTALDGTHGHIACISFTAGDDEYLNRVDNLALYDLDESELDFDVARAGEQRMLSEFFLKLDEALDREDARLMIDGHYHLNRDPIIVAHHADFDIRYIWQRAIALGVRPPKWWPINFNKYRDDVVQDTMMMWSGHGNRISLDRLCKTLGVPGKGAIDGSQVWDTIADGRFHEVLWYCDDDVRRLRSVHRRLRGLEPLREDIVQLTDDEGKDDEPYERPRKSFLKPTFTFFDPEVEEQAEGEA